MRMPEPDRAVLERRAEIAAALRAKGWHFYTDVDPGGAARLMCSWDTTPEDVAAVLEDATAASF